VVVEVLAVVDVCVVAPLELSVVNEPAAALVPPIDGGEANRAVMPVPLRVPENVIVPVKVKDPMELTQLALDPSVLST
jgi:hypothetical protein